MNKIKQNKITFTLILIAILIIFSSFTILSLPVLFNYKSKVTIIEKNFYKNFKLYLNSSGNVSYKPFPKPHLLVENASLNLSNSKDKNNKNLINVSNLKIFISLRDIFLRSFNNFISVEISNSNLEFQLSDLKQIRKHLYKSINGPIIFNNCKIFIKNKNEEVIIISPIKKINYKINNKTKIKTFTIDGEIFGLKFKSDWKRSYESPEISSHHIDIYNPNIFIKNTYKFSNSNNFDGQTEIEYIQDKLKYDITFKNNTIKITSPSADKTNFNIDSNINLNPFYLNGELTIKNKKVEKIIDNILTNLFLYDENFLGNINGVLKIKFKDLNNKLIKRGEIDFVINEKNIKSQMAYFNLDKIGKMNTEIKYISDQGDIKFFSKNHLYIKNHIEFARVFQISSKKVKKVNNIYFDLEKKIGESNFLISNIKLNNLEKKELQNKSFEVKNIQNLRSYLRQIIN